MLKSPRTLTSSQTRSLWQWLFPRRKQPTCWKVCLCVARTWCSVSVHDPGKYLKNTWRLPMLSTTSGTPRKATSWSPIATWPRMPTARSAKLTWSWRWRWRSRSRAPRQHRWVLLRHKLQVHSSHTPHFRGYYRHTNLEEGMYIVHTIMSFTCTVLLPHMPGIRYAPLGDGACLFWTDWAAASCPSLECCIIFDVHILLVMCLWSMMNCNL